MQSRCSRLLRRPWLDWNSIRLIRLPTRVTIRRITDFVWTQSRTDYLQRSPHPCEWKWTCQHSFSLRLFGLPPSPLLFITSTGIQSNRILNREHKAKLTNGSFWRCSCGTQNLDYFSKQGIPGPKPLPFVGNLWGMWKKVTQSMTWLDSTSCITSTCTDRTCPSTTEKWWKNTGKFLAFSMEYNRHCGRLTTILSKWWFSAKTTSYCKLNYKLGLWCFLKIRP